jgi:hypothetical protein
MNIPQRYQSDYKYLSYLSISIIAAMILFGSFVLGLISINGAILAGSSIEFYFIVANVVLTYAGINVARFTYHKRLQYIHVDTFSIQARLEHMKTLIFLHHALTAIPGILSIICLLLFGRYLMIIILIISIVEMIRKYPKEKTITNAVKY